MGMYLRAKSEVSSIILTSFRQGRGSFTPPTPLHPLTSKRTPKKPTQIRVKELKNFRKIQENTCDRVFIKRDSTLLKRDSGTGVFL